MIKTLSMASHKNHNLSASEGFIIFLTSKLFTYFIGSFTLKMNPNQLLIYSVKVNIYIGFWTLKMKWTQYGICGSVTFKNARAMVFSKSGGRAAVFGRVQKIWNFWPGGCPCPNLPPLRGNFNVPPLVLDIVVTIYSTLNKTV